MLSALTSPRLSKHRYPSWTILVTTFGVILRVRTSSPASGNNFRNPVRLPLYGGVDRSEVADGFRSEIPKEKGATRAAGNRTAYCRQRAVECALAATTAILGEVRQAYL